ncbi:MAG: hypothetical protein A2086_07040 [Spirochaetes bacterium GWD1_27_9]|nr:MAG: hypothetical protein A2Z98_15670 [Spirochaetes bacterium GWB1_27_13]OHD26403.1 MAG: hypothetical protein A2Y34_14895 [Spirochaetes bacterium GWC1_27_15]OHD44452.1 MAG: hypothetical protein A2086_07040 [Spirochaetes bacterium GWD1_27_9]
MIKKNCFVLIFTIFIISNLFSLYKNPFWNDSKINNIFRINKSLKPIKIHLDNFLVFDYIKGVNSGLYYEFDYGISFSNFLFFNTRLKLGEYIPKFKLINFGTSFYPLSFLKLNANYYYRDFSKYKIGEHSLITDIELIFRINKIFSFTLRQGGNFRFVDLNIFDIGTVYKKDFLFNISFLWQIKAMFYPVFLYSFGISIGNFDDFDINTVNYWQINFINYFHLPKKLSIFLDGGFGFAGSLPFAGVLNRFFIRIGLNYEIKVL